LLFLAHATNRSGSGAGRLAQAPEPLSGLIDLIWLEAAYRRVRRVRPSLARAFFWLIVSELAVGARRFVSRLLERPSYNPVVRYRSFLYQAGTWNIARRVVAKVEFHFRELP
jgi:hypothetical protein